MASPETTSRAFSNPRMARFRPETSAEDRIKLRLRGRKILTPAFSFKERSAKTLKICSARTWI